MTHEDQSSPLTPLEVAELRQLKADVKELVEAWRAAGKTLAFVKFLGTIASSVAAIWALFRHGIAKP